MVVNCYFDKESTALIDLLDLYSNYAPELLDRLQFVIVDDGSPIKFELAHLKGTKFPLNLKFIRIMEDIPWNQGGARNLGVVYASSEKVLLTDLDHYFTESALENLLRQKVHRNVIYKMARYRQDKLIRCHPNTFLLCRSRFLELYGYDEEFSGNYGCDDEMFSYWQYMNGTEFRWLTKACEVRLRDFDVETETHTLVRDRERNLELLAERRAALRDYGLEVGHSRKFLAFTWDILVDSQREGVENHEAGRFWWRLRFKLLERLRRLSSRSPYQVS
jgi:glycosyltransferase involved in cell wall biosynthesis